MNGNDVGILLMIGASVPMFIGIARWGRRRRAAKVTAALEVLGEFRVIDKWVLDGMALDNPVLVLTNKHLYVRPGMTPIPRPDKIIALAAIGEVCSVGYKIVLDTDDGPRSYIVKRQYSADGSDDHQAFAVAKDAAETISEVIRRHRR